MSHAARDEAREAHMENLFAWICRQPHPEAAIAALEDYALRDLGAHLEQSGITTGIPGTIHGIIIAEVYHRFMHQAPPTLTGGDQ